MTKLNFLFSLRDRLCGLPQKDVEERLSFYSEMIEDRMEEGLSEEEAVAAVGSVDEIAAQIIMEIPPAKETAKPRRQFKSWEIILLILGSPIWLSLVIAAVAVVFSLLISVWAVFGSLVACSFAGVVSGIVFLMTGNELASVAMLALSLIFAGLSIFLFFGCKVATKGTVSLTKRIAKSIRKEIAV